MECRIEHNTKKILLGKSSRMSLAQNKTADLWRGFMQNRHLIKNAVGTDRYSLQIYPPTYFQNFNPAVEFEKWALIEVSNENDVPEGFSIFNMEVGLYAVFLYKGKASEGAKAFDYIFRTWFPASEYELDDRPHFEVLSEKYKNEDSDSEEEIWIPIKKKK